VGDDELRVERDALRKSAKGFGDGSETLKHVFDRLRSALSAEGACWGDDKTGAAFASTYTPTRDSAYTTFPSLAKSLKDIEGGIRAMAANYDRAEEASGG
jgi:uncharacterized protein YukE